MHPEEEINKRFVRDDAWIICDLDGFGMSSITQAHLAVGRVGGFASGISHYDLIELG